MDAKYIFLYLLILIIMTASKYLIFQKKMSLIATSMQYQFFNINIEFQFYTTILINLYLLECKKYFVFILHNLYLTRFIDFFYSYTSTKYAFAIILKPFLKKLLLLYLYISYI